MRHRVNYRLKGIIEVSVILTEVLSGLFHGECLHLEVISDRLNREEIKTI
jgi:hypothetical protein